MLIGFLEVVGIIIIENLTVEEFYIKGFSVFEIKIPGEFQVISLDEALTRGYRNRSRKKAIQNKSFVNLSGIEPGGFLAENTRSVAYESLGMNFKGELLSMKEVGKVLAAVVCGLSVLFALMMPMIKNASKDIRMQMVKESENLAKF